MDNKTFVSRLARLSNSDSKTVNKKISSLISIIRDRAADLDSIALPGFGNFVAMKRQERIIYDTDSGKRMLVPPQITMDFVPGSKLKKSVANE